MPPRTKNSPRCCRQLFQVYEAPDELSTNSSPPFTSCIFQEFLTTWCVKHRLSSITYLQSNGQAELTVKTIKRIVNGNTGPQGSLNNDNVAWAILQYRNTPIQNIGLSPVQLLLHHDSWFHSFTANPLQATPRMGSGTANNARHK